MGLRYVAAQERLHGIVEDVMRPELRYRSDIDLSQPAMQVEIRNHIARCLRDYPHGGEGVITHAGVEHCFMYVDAVNDDVVLPSFSLRPFRRSPIEPQCPQAGGRGEGVTCPIAIGISRSFSTFPVPTLG